MYGHSTDAFAVLRRQRGLLSQERPDQLAVYSGCASGEVLGGRARVDGLLDVVALPPLAGMSAAVVRVGAAPSSQTRARAPLKSFAMVASSAASRALVEFGGPFCGRTARRRRTVT